MASLHFLVGPPENNNIVRVDCPDGTTWSAVRDEFCENGCEPPTTCDGVVLQDEHVLGEPPLLTGAHLDATDGGPSSDDVPSGFRIVVESGPRQNGSVVLRPGETVLGRGHPLLGNDPLASRRHVNVTSRHGLVEVKDLQSTGGLTIDGVPLTAETWHEWRVGQLLRIGSSALVLELDHQRTPAGMWDHDHLLRPEQDGSNAPQPLEWPQLVINSTRSPIRWAALLTPIPVAAALAMWLHSPVLLAFMIFGPLGMLVTSWDERRRGRHTGRKATARLRIERREFRQDLALALRQERNNRRVLFPPPHALVEVAARARRAPPVQKYGAASLRLGHGSSPSVLTVLRNQERLSITLDEAPTVMPIQSGVTSLTTANETVSENVIEVLAASLIVLGPPDGVETEIVTRAIDQPRWAWAHDCNIGLRNAVNIPRENGIPGEIGATAESTSRRITIIDGRTPDALESILAARTEKECLIWVGTQPPPVPATEIRLDEGADACRLPTGHRFTLDVPPESWFPQVTRLAHRHRASGTEQGNRLPDRVTPCDVGTPSEKLLWDEGPTTDVPLGIGEDAQVVTLDLARSGPHALVAGTTGSGKSEALLGYLHGLFTRNSPSHVTALLIDYKGGATFSPLAGAPHVVGLVTDLDEGLAARALIALRAEISLREAVLSRSGATSYRDLPAQDPPLPRLFVVVDEFRVLAEELPEFVAGLVRLAAVGRSLGIHAVLATQRPGGIVTADMRANLDARLLLRVRDRADSVDVIDSPLGAYIPRDTPGRAYLSVGGEEPLVVQTTYTSAPEISTGQSRVFLTWQNSATCPQERAFHSSVGRDHHAQTCLEAFVEQARTAAQELPPVRRPLLPPLPEVLTELPHGSFGRQEAGGPAPGEGYLTWEELRDAAARPQPHDNDVFPIARVDLPHAQAQADIGLPLLGHLGIAGSSRSGRTLAAARCAEAALNHDRHLWWCGADIPAGQDGASSPDDAQSIARMLEFLSSPSVPATVVIDDWEALTPALTRINRGMGAEDLLELLRGAHTRGITLVITGGRSILSSRLSPILDSRVVLRHHDIADYSLAGLRPRQVPRRMPPGRGLVLPHGHELQFYLPAGHTEICEP